MRPAPPRPPDLFALSASAATLALIASVGACTLRHDDARAAADAGGDATGVRIHFPGPVPPPAAPAPAGARETDVPLSWIYLPEDPVPTGAAPDAVVGAVVPCGFRAAYGTVSPPVSPLALRLHAFAAPAPAGCAGGTVTVQRISLQRLRLGEFDVTDAVPHAVVAAAEAGDAAAPGAVPVPRARLRVVADDSSLPPPAARRVRACAVGDDASCAAGGVCARARDQHRGVCVPPLDPDLAAGGGCPAGAVEVTLEHGGYAAPAPAAAVPAPGPLRACLPACDAAGACGPGLACVREGDAGGAAYCLPRP